MTVNTITAGDSTNGALITAGGNDGTMVLQTGPAGGKINAVSLAADGTPTFVKQPLMTEALSLIRLNTANGYGAVNTKIRRFTNTEVSQGTNITYADSANNGASFTINVTGVYCISYSDAFAVQAHFGISRNSAQLTTDIVSITAVDALMFTYSAASNNEGNMSLTVQLTAGDVIRPHTTGAAAAASPAITKFFIQRVA